MADDDTTDDDTTDTTDDDDRKDDVDDKDDDIDWKAQARKHEREAKRTKAELEKVRRANQSDQEKAIEDAKAEGRTGALSEVGQRLAAAEIRAALAGVVPDPKAIVEDLNLAKYVGDDGEVDEDAVKALREKYVALGANKKTPSFDGGTRKPADAGEGDMNAFLARARDRARA